MQNFNKKWIQTGKSEGELGDDGSGDGKSDEEWPVTTEFPPEEYRPWIEFPHFLSLCVRIIALPLYCDVNW